MGDQRCHPWRMGKLLLLLPAIWLLSACSSQRDECARVWASAKDADRILERLMEQKGLKSKAYARLYCAHYLGGGGN